LHSAGWPLDANTYGGSFVYHMPNNQVVIGFVVGLDYSNPWLSPFEEFQRFKTHPNIRWYLEGDEAHGVKAGKRLAYGARAITAGGLLSLPKTVFPGGALVGCDAGYLNASRIKGSHAAIKTGMLAAEAAFEALGAGRSHDELTAYPEAFENSWLHVELNKSRNFKQWFKKGRTIGSLMTGIEQFVLRGHIPWTIHRTHAQRVHQQHQPRGKPAGAPHAERCVGAGEHQPREIRWPRGALLPGRRVRVHQVARGRGPVADQRAELRALQDL
jgi:electron-transferring-flavoprotein dehydrogenase